MAKLRKIALKGKNFALCAGITCAISVSKGNALLSGHNRNTPDEFDNSLLALHDTGPIAARRRIRKAVASAPWPGRHAEKPDRTGGHNPLHHRLLLAKLSFNEPAGQRSRRGRADFTPRAITHVLHSFVLGMIRMSLVQANQRRVLTT
ncbi:MULTISPECIES: hypothetical protein [Roseovarius]|nr:MULTISPECIES: hypothetical protein [unclassified Roseovarius]